MCTGKQVLRYFIILLSLACPSNIYLLIIIVVDQVGTCWGLQTGNIRWRKHERVWIFLHNSKVKTILDWMIWTNNISGIKWIFVPSFDWETYNCAASRTGDNRVPTSPPASGSPRVWWSPSGAETRWGASSRKILSQARAPSSSAACWAMGGGGMSTPDIARYYWGHSHISLHLPMGHRTRSWRTLKVVKTNILVWHNLYFCRVGHWTWMRGKGQSVCLGQMRISKREDESKTNIDISLWY